MQLVWLICALVCGCGPGSAAEPGSGRTAAVARPRPRANLGATRVLPVEANGEIEPSGLALLDGELLSVSDEDDSAIFRIVVGETSAEMEPFLWLEGLELRTPALDLEGIAVCDGRIFIVSEAADEVIEVERSGRARWLGGNVRDHAMARGLLSTPGAGLEGIACSERGGLVLAAEREPRALIWVDLDPVGVGAVQILDVADVTGAHLAFCDFSDLSSTPGHLWAMYRYDYQILEVVGDPGAVLALMPVLDFSSAALDPRYRYSSTRFGAAEGLAADDENFYVIDDNNDLPRAATPGDSRPLLYVIPRP